MALAHRPICEYLNRDLSPSSTQSYICPFECTSYFDYSPEKRGFIFANCRDQPTPRPFRPATKLIHTLASTARVLRSEPTASTR